MAYSRINVEFLYEGFNFKLDDYICSFADSIEEAVEEFKKIFDYYRGALVGESVFFGEIVVNWGQYFKQYNMYRGEYELHRYIKILIALGILSFQKRSNWTVISFGMFVNPKTEGNQRLFFTRRQDAVEYAKLSGWFINEVFQYSDQIISGDKLKEA